MILTQCIGPLYVKFPKSILQAINGLLSTILAMDFLHHFSNNLLPAFFPLLSILLGVIQVFVTRNAKDATVFQLFCQGNDIEIEKTNLTLVPSYFTISLHLQQQQEQCHTQFGFQ